MDNYNNLLNNLSTVEPFSHLEYEVLESWVKEGKLIELEPGTRILRPDELSGKIYYILSGKTRLLTSHKGKIHQRVLALQKRKFDRLGSLLKQRQQNQL